MKNSIILFFILSLFFISCNSNNSKQILPPENISDNVITENYKTNDSIDSNHSPQNVMIVLEKEESHTPITTDSDTMIYEMPAVTAALENALDYFRANNRYKDWDKEDKTRVVIRCIAEKDGSISNLRIVESSGNTDLDNEAIRLIKQAKLNPAKNENNEIIRSDFVIGINFPSL